MIRIMFDSFLNQLLGEADKQFTLAAGEPIFRIGTPVRHVYVVLEGRAQLVRHSRDGAALVLQRAQEGEVIAVASMFAARYHCDAVAHGAARLARVPRKRVEELQARDTAWLRELAARLARELQHTRGRAEILSMKCVEDRIDAWIEINGGALPARGRWVDLAQEIGVTPEALYRELARRRKSL